VNLSDLQHLLDYNYWARDRMLEALDALTTEQFTRALGGSFRSIRDTAAHMLAAEVVWYRRWIGESPRSLLDPSAFPDAASLRRAWAEHEAKMRAFLSAMDEPAIARVYEYTLVSGAAGASPFWQMLQHLVNHGTYHRGQVTTLLRQIDAKPPQPTDMIAFYRAQAAAART
jgi:uncharacterized damage-inducible protein DinB